MAKVIDAVCGAAIESESAEARLDRNGRSHYFCSAGCRESFEAHPECYIDGRTRSGAGEGRERERHEPPYTSTGLFTAPKFGSAGSGGLEYELLPEAHDPRRE